MTMAHIPEPDRFAFVALGANLPSTIGDAEATIDWAFAQLKELSSGPILRSSLYRTSPVDSPAGTPDFLNAMAGFLPLPDETPLSLLHKLQALENAAGRTRSGIINEARALDLDLVVFGAVEMHSDELMLPHPRAAERKFVLEPLLEITHDNFLLPGQHESVKTLLGTLPETQQIEKH